MVLSLVVLSTCVFVFIAERQAAANQKQLEADRLTIINDRLTVSQVRAKFKDHYQGLGYQEIPRQNGSIEVWLSTEEVGLFSIQSELRIDCYGDKPCDPGEVQDSGSAL